VEQWEQTMKHLQQRNQAELDARKKFSPLHRFFLSLLPKEKLNPESSGFFFIIFVQVN